MTTETTQDAAAKSGLTVTEIARPRNPANVPRYVSTTETIDVEISAYTLHDAGWHHENECPAGPGPLAPEPPMVDLRAAIEALHHQAHGAGSLVLCHAEPCASLSLEQLRGAA
jgi:hypothetical protein